MDKVKKIDMFRMLPSKLTEQTLLGSLSRLG